MQTTLIIGAGAIGLQSARLLALAGCKVTLIDQSAVGQEASWAGGGIVSPLYPWRYSEAITALAHWLQRGDYRVGALVAGFLSAARRKPIGADGD